MNSCAMYVWGSEPLREDTSLLLPMHMVRKLLLNDASVQGVA